MTPKLNCECGRPAVAIPKVKKRSSRAARARRPRRLKHHPECLQCYRKRCDSERAEKLK